jgi:branched-subunit amino acid aminotransferase/4-amino-4-deoxychorismate lyase
MAAMTSPTSSRVWLNGRLVPADGAHLSVYDRGFQIGDGVFEALRARRGVPIELAGHIARLHSSMASLAFELPFGDDEIARGVAELLAAEGLDGCEPDPPGDAVVRITVSRGFDPTRNVKPGDSPSPTVAIQVWPFVPPSERVLRDGESFVVSCVHRDPESPVASIKTTSRAELVYARIEAATAGADDALFVTTDGRLTEATTSNLLLVKGERCATPRLGTAILAGTTRAWLMAHGADAGLEMAERDLRLDDVWAADEMAACSSIAGVVPIVSLDGRAIGSGKPGPLTMALRQVREDWIDGVSLEGVREVERR